MSSCSWPWGVLGEGSLDFQRRGATRTYVSRRTGLERRHPAPAARTTHESPVTARLDGHVKRGAGLGCCFHGAGWRSGSRRSPGRAHGDIRDDEKFGKKFVVL